VTDHPLGSPLAAGSSSPPCRLYDVALLDLDGVVYVGPDAVPGVPEALGAARAAGMRLGFVTNNAARTPEQVAVHLGELGVAPARTRRTGAGGRRARRGRRPHRGRPDRRHTR
jgi:glycerol 3-phosphatase-2